MDDQTINAVTGAIRTVTDAGYVLVKLPEMVVDQDGFETWPVVSHDSEACVRVRRSDGRLTMDSVSHPFASAEHARSLAAALIAAAQYIQANAAIL